MRLVPAAALVVTVLACLPARAEEEARDDASSAPPAAKDYDWDSLFEPGDDWKKTPQVFVWNNDAEPETLDPAKMTGVTEHNLALALYEGLASHHPETLEPLPGAAQSWTVSDDGLVYTFHLRKDGRWSNGDPVTAEDFRWSWQRALTPATECKYTEMFHPIRGAEAYYAALAAGKPADFADVGVEAVDEHTLRVTLHAPTAYFLELCAFETLMPVHRASVERHAEKWTQAGNLVGNGPFALAAWKPRDRIEVVRNPHWWNRRIVRLDRMTILPIDDQSTAFNEYLNGGVDWIRSVGAAKVEQAQAHADYYVSPYLGTYFFRFNTTRAPFGDVRVRKAFDQAVDKRAICEKVLKAGQVPATGVVALGIHGYPELKGLPYDPGAARALLAEAGFPEGKGFPDVEILYNTSESHKQVCEALVEMWRNVLGVRVQLKNCEWQVYLEDTRKLRYQISRAGWIGDYADPNTFLDLWVTGRGNNNTGWSNARYDALIAAASKELDPKKRFALFEEAERIVCVEDLPILPVYYYVNQGMLRPRVRGWRENVRDLHPFQYVWLDGPATGK